MRIFFSLVLFVWLETILTEKKLFLKTLKKPLKAVQNARRLDVLGHHYQVNTIVGILYRSV